MAGVPQGPASTADLIGHHAAEQTLLDAYNGGRLHHAWLLTGPRGIGKATLAYRFARYLLANPDSGPDPAAGAEPGLFGDPEPASGSLFLAPSHPTFQRVAAGGHGDLQVVTCGFMPDGRPRNEIVVDDVRALSDFYTRTSAEGGWRVAIVDGADIMNRNAANALLKILEEPPARSVLLLVAHAPGRVLPTILSRCRKLPLRPLDRDAVKDFIATRHPELEAGDRDLVAALAAGSPGQATVLLDGDGLDLYRRMVQFLASLPNVEPAVIHGLGEELGGRGADTAFRLFMTLLGGFLGRIARAGAGAAIPDAIPGEAEVIARLAAIASLDRWIEVWEKITGILNRADAAGFDRKPVVITTLADLVAVTRP